MSEDMANVCASLCGMAPLRPYGVTLFVDMHDGLTGCFRQPTPHSDSVYLQVQSISTGLFFQVRGRSRRRTGSVRLLGEKATCLRCAVSTHHAVRWTCAVICNCRGRALYSHPLKTESQMALPVLFANKECYCAYCTLVNLVTY